MEKPNKPEGEPNKPDLDKRVKMECKVVIQERLENGENYMHDFSLEHKHIEDALKYRSEDSNCVFVIKYSLN